MGKKTILLKNAIRSYLKHYQSYKITPQTSIFEVNEVDCDIVTIFPETVDESEPEKWTGVSVDISISLTTGFEGLHIIDNYYSDNIYFRILRYDFVEEKFSLEPQQKTIPLSKK